MASPAAVCCGSAIAEGSHAELDAFLAIDSAIRETEGSSTLATELRFGFADSVVPAVEVTLSDGRTIRFHGSADRVDRDGTGALVVIDYKTGSSRNRTRT